MFYVYTVRTKFRTDCQIGILLDSQEVCTWILRVLQHLSCRLGTLNARLKAGDVLLDWLWNIWQAQRTDHDVCVVEFSKTHSFLTVWIDFKIKTLHKNKLEVFVFILVETDHSLFERHDMILFIRKMMHRFLQDAYKTARAAIFICADVTMHDSFVRVISLQMYPLVLAILVVIPFVVWDSNTSSRNSVLPVLVRG